VNVPHGGEDTVPPAREPLGGVSPEAGARASDQDDGAHAILPPTQVTVGEHTAALIVVK
jgi:CobQ-like glutamine amidotransferase family enzyme